MLPDDADKGESHRVHVLASGVNVASIESRGG